MEARSWRPEVGGQKLEAGSWRPAGGHNPKEGKLKAISRRPEVGGMKLEARSWRPEVSQEWRSRRNAESAEFVSKRRSAVARNTRRNRQMAKGGGHKR